MTPHIPPDLMRKAAEWPALHRWERKQLGLALRRLGLTYSEIQTIIPVASSTLSNWCRDLKLTDAQVLAIRERTGPHTQRGIPRDTQRKRRAEIEGIRSEAREFARHNLHDSYWVGGVVLYWAEGSKTRNTLDLVNTDPAVLRYFVRWVRSFLDQDAEFVLGLHLHSGNDEAAAKRYWSQQLSLPESLFGKSFIKTPGTGHRKNQLPHGVCRVRTRRAANHWNRVMEWIDVIAGCYGR